MLCTIVMLQLYTTTLVPITQASTLQCTTKMHGHVLCKLELTARLKVIWEAPYLNFAV